MIRIAWRSLLAHKLRSFLTVLAILLGVAMISGTYVFTDQINKAFEQIFDEAYAATDVTITPKASFTSQYSVVLRGLPESMVEDVRAVDGVGEAHGYISGVGAIAIDGKVVETGGSPTLFFSYVPSELSATSYVDGSPPDESGDLGISKGVAEDEGLEIGSPVTVITDTGAYETTVSGVFEFASEGSLGGSILLNTTLEDGQAWFDMDGRVSEIDVAAAEGVTPETLAGSIRDFLPGDVDVKTGEQAAADQSAQISDLIGSFLNPVLLSLGGVAVLVGAFIIFNAFSMTVAQRRREFAMLRALGASRRQVLLSITGEALVMGVLASVVGLFVGLGFADAVNALMKALDVDIPISGLVMQPRTVAVGLVVGISITLLSAVVPAVRATRVPPVAALQEGSSLPPTRYSRYTKYIAVAVAVLGVIGVVNGMYGVGSTTQRLLAMAVGAVLLFVAVAMLSKYFVAPVAGFIGWPLMRLAKTSGRLARDNSMRNPARTAATASALMIGLGVVVFVAVFAQGLKSSFVDSFDEVVRADYVVTGKNYLALPNETLRRIEVVPAVEAVAGIDFQQVQVDGNEASRPPLYAIDPHAFSQVWSFDWLDGEDGLLAKLASDGAVVEEQTASSLGLKTGERFEVLTADGTTAEFKVLGTYRDPMMLNGITVSTAAFNRLFPRPQLYMVFATTGGESEAVTASIEGAVAHLPTADVMTATEYKDSIVGQIDQMLNLLYGLLTMSVIISLFGIVNTLVLSVYERTREIGLLRAIGASRRQIRRSVRYESVITSVIGGVLGIVVGIVFAYVVTTRFGGMGIRFSVPGVQLVAFLVVAVVVGVLAAILPARRAARMDILEAIHYE
jgi:putative ABC transport system permease protein